MIYVIHVSSTNMGGSSSDWINEGYFDDREEAQKYCDEQNNADRSYLDAQDGRPHFSVKSVRPFTKRKPKKKSLFVELE